MIFEHNNVHIFKKQSSIKIQRKKGLVQFHQIRACFKALKVIFKIGQILFIQTFKGYHNHEGDL